MACCSLKYLDELVAVKEKERKEYKEETRRDS
jgi:hypothetical protein